MDRPRVDEIKLGLGFFGGCGVNNAKLITEKCDPETYSHLYLLAANTDGRQLEKHFNPDSPADGFRNWLKEMDRIKILQLGYELTRGMGAGADPKVGKEATEASMEKISSFLNKVQALILVGGLGGGSGTGALPLVAEEARRMSIPTLAIVTFPLIFEGKTRLKRAAEARRKLIEEIGVPTITIYNENIPDKNVDILQAWRNVNASCLEPMLLVLRESFQSVGDGIGNDLADWKTVLSQGNLAYFGYSSANGHDPQAIAKELVENRFQDTEIIQGTKVMNLWFHGRWTLAEAESVIGHVRETIRSESGSSAEIEAHCGFFQEAADNAKWIGIVAIAEDPSRSAAAKKEGLPEKKGKVVTLSDQTRSGENRPSRPPIGVIRFKKCGEPIQRSVTASLATRWGRAIAMIKPDPAEIEMLRKEIQAETGDLPDQPPNVSPWDQLTKILNASLTASAGEAS